MMVVTTEHNAGSWHSEPHVYCTLTCLPWHGIRIIIIYFRVMWKSSIRPGLWTIQVFKLAKTRETYSRHLYLIPQNCAATHDWPASIWTSDHLYRLPLYFRKAVSKSTIPGHKPAVGVHLVYWNCFTKSVCMYLSMYTCTCVCLSVRTHVSKIWSDKSSLIYM